MCQRTLYSTTYPCHNCARHIVAAGIREVVYIEPYTKSLAIDLHRDAIREETGPTDSAKQKLVHFRLFSGVAPQRFALLFEKRRSLKDDSGFFCEDTAGPLHRDPIFTKSFQGFEEVIAKRVEEKLRSEANDE